MPKPPLVTQKDAHEITKTCRWCQSLLHTPHEETCVRFLKTVEMDFIFKVQVEVPHSWSKEDIEFYYGGGSWCANNAFAILRQQEIKGCWCEENRFQSRYLRTMPEKEETPHAETTNPD